MGIDTPTLEPALALDALTWYLSLMPDPTLAMAPERAPPEPAEAFSTWGAPALDPALGPKLLVVVVEASLGSPVVPMVPSVSDAIGVLVPAPRACRCRMVPLSGVGRGDRRADSDRDEELRMVRRTPAVPPAPVDPIATPDRELPVVETSPPVPAVRFNALRDAWGGVGGSCSAGNGGAASLIPLTTPSPLPSATVTVLSLSPALACPSR